MVLAGQAVARRIAQNLAHDVAQGILHQEIVANQIVCHQPLPGAASLAGREFEVEASVARCLRTPPIRCYPVGLRLVLGTAYAATATGAKLSLATIALAR
ncbi:hypothetical protein Maq22A_1p37310 (plasmid) [Methylobacterium aquaticum]|uniref:Uncharacterized protein n=1 Tax=Methylobacterium aquaticum TaxID=270351 RepID=A0A0C6G1A8_9HYPH|nr:hypothetical protein Maq22A_1p37310 [Methylobacterium aquaticum]